MPNAKRLLTLSLLILPLIVQAQDDALPEGATLIAEGFRFPEGPVIDSEGNLIFSDPRDNALYKWDGKQAAKLDLVTEAGNGLAFDKDGNLFICEGAGAKVSILMKDGARRVAASHADGLPLAAPNDLVFDDNGNLFFTNPGRSGVPTVVRISPGKQPTIVAGDAQYPNGIGISPDGKYLYVNDTMGGSALWRYPLDEKGNLGEGSEFVNFGKGAPDGMAIAASGNIYIAMNLAANITVVSPDGEILNQYPFPRGSGTTNICFGGPDWKTLYITCGASGKVYQMPAPEPGMVPYSHRN